MRAPRQLDLLDRPVAIQLQLVTYQNPLRERLGRDFFKLLPRRAGIYQFFDSKGQLLYVGKAKDLKSRLTSYTQVHLKNSSKKVVRLVAIIAQVKIEELPDERAALLRENFLLRTHRPPFNVLNNSSHTYLFQHVDLNGASLRLHIDMREDQRYRHVFGAFKSRSLLYQTQAALLRLLNAICSEGEEARRIPAMYFKRLKLNHQNFRFQNNEMGQEFFNLTRRFYAGLSPKLIKILGQTLELKVKDLFLLHVLKKDLETLEAFYLRCSRRLRRVCKNVDGEAKLVLQSELDDLFVKAKFKLRDGG